MSGLAFHALQPQQGSAFYRGQLQVHERADTFLSLNGWTKGVVFINGFNLGRYWNIGPQKTLYVPGPLLREGANEIVIFELYGTELPEIDFVEQPDLG
ncbi:beta galactosidase jelly roll domain-containing protein [Paenibacillus sp. AR247]|uniref:beta galactosidase jelly roll domain-containing protein n=1 Tax=Paenibacillus sp. AR247 TaxID=1631599 RepID=UPI000CF8CBAC|nr:hypothetical protein CPT76_14395 [Paenibacillus sp. AR247]